MRKLIFCLCLLAFSPLGNYGATVTVEIRNNFFSPASVTVNVGDTVTWVQRGSNHDTVSYDNLWSSGILAANRTFSFQFMESGSFRYYCTPHENQGMIGTVTVRAANQLPVVTLTSPSAGATFSTTDTIAFSATATDDGTISKVEFFDGATLIGTDSSLPYTVTTNLSAGTHSITAKATDNANGTATSGAVSITVNAPVNQPPTITLSSPQANKVIAAPGTVAVSATVADADGSVSQVEFFNGAASLGVDPSAPFEFTSTNLAAGAYSITGVATDNAGAKTTSTAIQVGVAAQPKIDSIARVNNAWSINVSGTSGVPHVLESSTDLAVWTPMSTNSPSGGAVTFTDPENGARKMYRVVAR